MTPLGTATNWTERRKLLTGTVALALASLCVASLGTLGIGRGVEAMAVGLLAVVLFVVATLSIGTSERTRI